MTQQIVYTFPPRNGNDLGRTVTMPIEVYDATATLIEEFLTADYWERIKYFCGEAATSGDPEYAAQARQAADALEAAFTLYEDWQIACAAADDAVADESQQQLSF
jgi:hypothetical protein